MKQLVVATTKQTNLYNNSITAIRPHLLTEDPVAVQVAHPFQNSLIDSRQFSCDLLSLTQCKKQRQTVKITQKTEL
jgi:hypothetical protein